MKRSIPRPLFGLLCALAVGRADASAHLPAVDMPPEHLASFSACVAVLEQHEREDRQGVNEAPKPLENGGTVTKSLETQGVQHTGKTTAGYQATVGWRTRSRVGDEIETNFTYEVRDLRCENAVLHSRPSGGAEEPLREPFKAQ